MSTRTDYGFDAPYLLIALGGVTLAIIAMDALAFATSRLWLAWAGLAVAVVLVLSMASFLFTTRRGKFMIWAELLDSIVLRGDEHLLDVGCGRGAVLMLAAQRLPRGRAVGVDLWAIQQSGNSEQATLHNAEIAGVRPRIELHTADMCNLPFPDRSFDVVTSSLAI